MKRITTAAVVAAMLAAAAIALAAEFTARNGELHATVIDIYAAKHEMVATGGVKLTTVEGVLLADRMEATLDANNYLTSAQAIGKVKVDLDWVGSDKKRRRVNAQGDHGTYNVGDRTVVLTGHVTGKAVEVEANTSFDLNGDKVTMFLRESRYRVEGAPAKITYTEPEPAPETPPK